MEDSIFFTPKLYGDTPIKIQAPPHEIRKPVMLAAVVLFFTGTAMPLFGQVTTFTSQSAFDDAVNVTTTEDFESFEPANGGAGDTDVSGVTVGSVFDLNGFSITESPVTRSNSDGTYQTIDTEGDNSRDSFGNVNGSAYLSVGLQSAGDDYSFGIDPGFTAIGYDYRSWSNGGHNHVHTFTFADGSTFTVNPKGGADFSSLSTSGFFGLLSNSPVVSLDFEFISTSSLEGAGFDNFVFGNASAVPEPSSLLALVSLGGIGFLRRRRGS